MSTPQRTRPTLPEGYGLPASTDGLLDWAAVDQRLTAARNYWLSTVRPDGRPHVVPRWGVWLDNRFYYDGAATTVHARNAEQNPACTMTLESGTEVVIVEGRSTTTQAELDGLGGRLAAAFAKYAPEYEPAADSWAGPDGGGLRVLIPQRVLAWFAFPTDCTRFVF